MRLKRLKPSARTSIFVRPGRLNERAMRKSRFVWYGSRNALRPTDGMRLVPPLPSRPVRMRFAGGALPLTKPLNGAPDEAVMTGANVKPSSNTLFERGCHTALKLKRCGTSKFDTDSSRLRSCGLSTLFAAVNVCDDWPLSRERENV